MKKLCRMYNNLSKQVRDSFKLSVTIVGLVSTVLSIIGVTVNDLTKEYWISTLIVMGFWFALTLIIYCLICAIYKSEVNFSIRSTDISITHGDIFKTPGWKVIGCDSHFDLRIDDVVISKQSIHGQFVLKHANVDELRKVIAEAAKSKGIKADKEGLFTFPLGTIIPYQSSVDGQKYLLLAMNNLDKNNEVHTNMALHEQMLTDMWGEIDGVYALNDIVLPVLGTGITRFDDGHKEPSLLLRCMLCTLNNSIIDLKSKVTIVLYGNRTKDIDLYEYKDMFNSTNRRKD